MTSEINSSSPGGLNRGRMPKGFARQVIMVTACKLLVNTGRRFIYPFAPVLSRSLEVPLTAITTIIAAGQFTSLLGIFSGPLADRFGCRVMMRLGLALLAIGMLLCGLAPFYWPVFVGLVIASFGKTIFDPAIQAFIGNNVPFERRGRVIGIVETAWAGSTLIGIPALALIIDSVGIQSSFYLLALLGAVGWMGIGRSIPSDTPAVPQQTRRIHLLVSIRELIRIRPALGMLGFGFMISIANDSIFVVYGAWFEQDFMVSIVTLGLSTVAIGSAELLGEALTSLFSDRLGLKRTVIFGLAASVCSYLLLPVIGTSLPLAMAGLFFLFLCFELTMVTSFSLCTELMPGSRATMMAGYYAASGVGRMLGVLIGGVVWKAAGIGGVALCSAALTSVGLLALLWGLHGWSHGDSRH